MVGIEAVERQPGTGGAGEQQAVDVGMFDQSGLGGSDRQWMTVTMYIYELGWGPTKSFGRAAAVSWILFLIIILVGAVNFWITRRISSGDAKKTPDPLAAAKDAKEKT